MQQTEYSGVVVDPDGRPVEGAYVTVEWGTAPTPEITLVTGEKGAFRLLLPDGDFRIVARTPDGREGVCVMRAGVDDRNLRIELRPKPDD